MYQQMIFDTTEAISGVVHVLKAMPHRSDF